MKHILNIAVVNFHATWGAKEENYERILGYIECAHKRGADMIIFPEMCLTGYDNEKEVETNLKMQHREAESKYGMKADELSQLAKAYKMYIMLGMPERDKSDDHKVFNTLLVVQPDTFRMTYRKIHLALDEPQWAEAGDAPLLLNTPWGPVGVTICYDIYAFPELVRYYAAKGARLIINSTAYARSRGYVKGKTTLESTVLMNGIYVATANLCGKDLENYFWGGSSIIGPSQKIQDVCYYAGKPFDAEGADEEAMYLETIDLSLAGREIYQVNPLLGRSDFRGEIYARLYGEL